MIVPYYYQREAIDSLYEYWQKEKGNPLIVAPCGSGKSIIIAQFIYEAMQYPGTRILVLTHRKELLVQNESELRMLWPEAPTGFYSAGLGKKDRRAPILFAGIQTAHNKLHTMDPFDLVLIDECFTGDTLVSTPSGERRIDQVSCGDIVYNLTGTGVIESKSARPSYETYTVELSNGRTIECTGNHPFFTPRGWIKAASLEVGEGLYGIQDVRRLWERVSSLDKVQRGRHSKELHEENLWIKQEYCSVRCAKRHDPTVLSAQDRKKISETMKEHKHQPIKRGGNGQLLPLPQLALLHAFGPGWEAELSIKTEAGHRNGVYPNCYKVDIGNRKKMIAIELDGGSHSSIERKEKDAKKDEMLTSLGWSVYRVTNERALELYTTFESVDTLLTSLME